MYIKTHENCSPTHPTAILTIHGTEDSYNGLTWKGVTYYLALDDVNKYWADYNNTETTPTIVQMPDLNSSDESTAELHSYNNCDNGVLCWTL